MLSDRDPRLITCVLPHGEGFPILVELHERGINRADVHSARAFLDAGDGRLYDHVESDILSVIVPTSRTHELFEWLCEQTGVADRPGRFVHVVRLASSTGYVLPGDVPEEHD